MNRLQRLLTLGLALASGFALTACRTVPYRQVQSDFERAVQAETAGTESPFVDWYRGVADTLTPDYIGRLDDPLRPNAWMLRGVSEWRLADYSNAVVSAASGLDEIGRQESVSPEVAHARDAVVLTLLPGLVQDSKLRDRLQALGTNVLTADRYRTDYVRQFQAVLTSFEEARRHFSAATPQAVRDYWSFQLWRVLQNWSFTLSRLIPGESSTMQAYAEADAILSRQPPYLAGGSNMISAIQSAKAAIPSGHPYRRLIELEEHR